MFKQNVRQMLVFSKRGIGITLLLALISSGVVCSILRSHGILMDFSLIPLSVSLFGVMILLYIRVTYAFLFVTIMGIVIALSQSTFCYNGSCISI